MSEWILTFGNSSEYPTAMNVELYMRLRQMLDEAKKELLDCDTQRAWCKHMVFNDHKFVWPASLTLL